MENTETAESTTPKLILSSIWEERLDNARQRQLEKPSEIRVIPKNPQHYAEKVHFVDDEAKAVDMLDFARQSPLSFIGLDSEYRYTSPGVPMKRVSGKDLLWYDPRSVMPLLLSVALTQVQNDGRVMVYPFVVDLRRPEVLGFVQDLLCLPVPFVAHYAQAELICLWKLNLPVPRTLWDTWGAEKAFCLGLYHARYENEHPADELGEAITHEAAEEKCRSKLTLTSTCLRRGVHYPFVGSKERLQQSFLSHPEGQPFSEEQIEYAAADAIAVAGLYPIQVQIAVQQGCLQHLVTVEMPWTVTNGKMVWDGVRVDRNRLTELREACEKHVQRMQPELATMGLDNVRSHEQVKGFFQSQGLLNHFLRGDKYSFDDGQLTAARNLHPAIPKIIAQRKMLRLLGDKLLTGELIGADGRLHPDHRQLGSQSGRNAMRWPSIGGIGKALRPLVVPEPGFAIGEVDLCQIEVGIAAAVYRDPDLIRMFNGQDVYCAMARQFYADQLTPKQMSLPDGKFKKQCSNYRDKMKTYTLAVVYGITKIGLAIQLGISELQAEKERQRFLEMFPKLTQALQEAAAYGAIRGFAYLCSGLRRYRGRSGYPWGWEHNWLMNTPVQGSAGIVFKAAGNRLRLRYEHYGTKLILPMHDAFIFECPKEHLRDVAKITAEVMRSTVQEYFPVLEPRVDVNIDHPHCWNKDGKHGSLRRWMINPDLALR